MTLHEPLDRQTTAAADHLTITNPVTGETIGAVPIQTDADVRAAVARARIAQRGWEAIGAKTRASILIQFADLLWADRDRIIRVIRAETGKNEGSALAEVIAIDGLAQYYAHNAPRFLAPQRRMPIFPVLQRGKMIYAPYGVVGAITPWNYPLANAFLDALPALFAGNAVILKPSEFTPYTAIEIAKLLHRAGVPEHVLQIITGDGRSGAAVVDHVDCITFTGSPNNGRRIAIRCAERLIPCWLEMGGKDPALVLKDADLDVAASSVIRGGTENAGQMCIGTKRVYVEASVYDAFLARLQTYLKGFVIGKGDGYDVHMGSLINARELERCERHVADALAKGAKLIYGGKRRPDLGALFYEPAFLVDVDHSMTVMREETFGPVIPIMKVASESEAIALANDSDYGLSSALFTRDLQRGEQLATHLLHGDTIINNVQMAAGSHALAWGGRKGSSGIGRRGGVEGLMRFVNPQALVIDSARFLPPRIAIADAMSVRLYANVLRPLRRRFRWLS